MTRNQIRSNQRRELIIRDTHRALWYEDGVLKQVLGAGRYEYPYPRLLGRTPEVNVVLVDMRERDLTIKGQEILTSDKVAIRVSIVVSLRVVDPTLAVHAVDDYEARVYTDVQLAARRSLASMSLEDILTSRNKLSEDILADVKEAAERYGVEIGRADVKDLIFPGNLQAIMNQVLTAERVAEARLIEARSKAEVDRLDSETKAESRRVQAEAYAEETRLHAEATAQAKQAETDALVRDLEERLRVLAEAGDQGGMLRVLELDALRDLAQTASARLYFNFTSEMLKASHEEN
ncbi:MAG: slipin family protein [Chloroflexota bacterium]|jgi:regulator of protease activity HflC (stomatin/prohibitin superfamily)